MFSVSFEKSTVCDISYRQSGRKPQAVRHTGRTHIDSKTDLRQDEYIMIRVLVEKRCKQTKTTRKKQNTKYLEEKRENCKVTEILFKRERDRERDRE